MPPSPIALLQSRLGQEWPAVELATAAALKVTERIEKATEGLTSTDAGLVIFGSLARKEWTTGSDVDWTLLIDGQADPEHLEVAHNVAHSLKEEELGPPGASGLFGSMTFSHDLIQKIGGRGDTNENTTRRVLLIQESRAFGKTGAHDRVLKHIFSRYLKDDRGLRFGSQPFKVPIGHCRQVDPTMNEAYLILREFQNRLTQIHMSDVNSRSTHDALSGASICAFEKVAFLIPENIPVILESPVEDSEVQHEIENARLALPIRSATYQEHPTGWQKAIA